MLCWHTSLYLYIYAEKVQSPQHSCVQFMCNRVRTSQIMAGYFLSLIQVVFVLGQLELPAYNMHLHFQRGGI
jgi:hypothetical protein